MYSAKGEKRLIWESGESDFPPDIFYLYGESDFLADTPAKRPLYSVQATLLEYVQLIVVYNHMVTVTAITALTAATAINGSSQGTI